MTTFLAVMVGVLGFSLVFMAGFFVGVGFHIDHLKRLTLEGMIRRWQGWGGGR